MVILPIFLEINTESIKNQYFLVFKIIQSTHELM
jgi:hypothetical protein